MEDGTGTILEDHFESTVRQILPEVVQSVISTQQRHDSSPPSMGSERNTSTNGNANIEQIRPSPRVRPIETRELCASEFIIQAQ